MFRKTIQPIGKILDVCQEIVVLTSFIKVQKIFYLTLDYNI